MTGVVGDAGTTGGRPGQIVFLNGTSSSGTTSLARAVQDAMAPPYLHTGIDHFLKGLPSRLLVYLDPAARGAAPTRVRRSCGRRFGVPPTAPRGPAATVAGMPR